MTLLQFRESLVRSLLLGIPFENVKPAPRELSTSQTKGKFRDRKLEEKQGSDRDVRKRCVGCYAENREQQSREACHATTKRGKLSVLIATNFFCLDCFNEKHHSMK